MVRIDNVSRAGRNPALNGTLSLRNSEDSTSNMSWGYQERQILAVSQINAQGLYQPLEGLWTPC